MDCEADLFVADLNGGLFLAESHFFKDFERAINSYCSLYLDFFWTLSEQ